MNRAGSSRLGLKGFLKDMKEIPCHGRANDEKIEIFMREKWSW